MLGQDHPYPPVENVLIDPVAENAMRAEVEGLSSLASQLDPDGCQARVCLDTFDASLTFAAAWLHKLGHKPDAILETLLERTEETAGRALEQLDNEG